MWNCKYPKFIPIKVWIIMNSCAHLEFSSHCFTGSEQIIQGFLSLPWQNVTWLDEGLFDSFFTSVKHDETSLFCDLRQNWTQNTWRLLTWRKQKSSSVYSVCFVSNYMSSIRYEAFKLSTFYVFFIQSGGRGGRAHGNKPVMKKTVLFSLIFSMWNLKIWIKMCW